MAEDEYSEEPGQPLDSEIEEHEDGTVTVKLPQPEGTPEEIFNLVPQYDTSDKGKKFLKKVAEKVIKDFDADWESCSAWREKRKNRWRLLVGDIDPKTFPFEGCANLHLPVMLERVLRIVHRLYGEMFPERDDIFAAVSCQRPVGRARRGIATAARSTARPRVAVPEAPYSRFMRRVHSRRFIPSAATTVRIQWRT